VGIGGGWAPSHMFPAGVGKCGQVGAGCASHYLSCMRDWARVYTVLALRRKRHNPRDRRGGRKKKDLGKKKLGRAKQEGGIASAVRILTAIHKGGKEGKNCMRSKHPRNF